MGDEDMLSILNTLPAIKSVSQRVAAIAEDRKGVTALEYGVIAAAIVVALVAIVFTLGSTVSSTFNSINQGITNKGTATTTP
jgi:pilus assembly protein Flp/PilA